MVVNTTWLVCQQHLLGHNNVNTDFYFISLLLALPFSFKESQFPDQRLNPGHGSENTKSLY